MILEEMVKSNQTKRTKKQGNKEIIIFYNADDVVRIAH